MGLSFSTLPKKENQSLNMKTLPQLEKDYDIVVVGLGISGLYLCHQLLKKDSSIKILACEKSTRIGGRLQSLPLECCSWALEGGAQRFFPKNSPILLSLLDEMDLKSIRVNNASNSLKHQQQASQMFSCVKRYMPSDEALLPTFSLAQLICLTGTSGESQCSSYPAEAPVDVFVASTGYPLFRYDMNAQQAYQTLDKVTQQYQMLIEGGGYEHLCHLLFQGLLGRIDVCMDVCVEHLEWLTSGNGAHYSVNGGRWNADKVAWTAPRNSLISLPQYPKWMHSSIIEPLKNNYFSYVGIRVYLQFQRPWWNSDQVFQTTFTNGNGPLNQVVYYSTDTLLIYNNMDAASLLHGLLGNTQLLQCMQWYPSSLLADDTKKLLFKWLYTLIGDQLSYNHFQSMHKFLYCYNEEAAQFMHPCKSGQSTNYETWFQRIQYGFGKKFWLVSGDYTKDPGWVESCLKHVDQHIIPNIISYP